ncbi:hypothetical protein CERSUDRAFT_78624, partial [Gelatoporia subvermispora B]
MLFLTFNNPHQPTTMVAAAKKQKVDKLKNAETIALKKKKEITKIEDSIVQQEEDNDNEMIQRPQKGKGHKGGLCHSHKEGPSLQETCYQETCYYVTCYSWQKGLVGFIDVIVVSGSHFTVPYKGRSKEVPSSDHEEDADSDAPQVQEIGSDSEEEEEDVEILDESEAKPEESESSDAVKEDKSAIRDEIESLCLKKKPVVPCNENKEPDAAPRSKSNARGGGKDASGRVTIQGSDDDSFFAPAPPLGIATNYSAPTASKTSTKGVNTANGCQSSKPEIVKDRRLQKPSVSSKTLKINSDEFPDPPPLVKRVREAIVVDENAPQVGSQGIKKDQTCTTSKGNTSKTSQNKKRAFSDVELDASTDSECGRQIHKKPKSSAPIQAQQVQEEENHGRFETPDSPYRVFKAPKALNDPMGLFDDNDEDVEHSVTFSSPAKPSEVRRTNFPTFAGSVTKTSNPLAPKSTMKSLAIAKLPDRSQTTSMPSAKSSSKSSGAPEGTATKAAESSASKFSGADNLRVSKFSVSAPTSKAAGNPPTTSQHPLEADAVNNARAEPAAHEDEAVAMASDGRDANNEQSGSEGEPNEDNIDQNGNDVSNTSSNEGEVPDEPGSPGRPYQVDSKSSTTTQTKEKKSNKATMNTLPNEITNTPGMWKTFPSTFKNWAASQPNPLALTDDDIVGGVQSVWFGIFGNRGELWTDKSPTVFMQCFGAYKHAFASTAMTVVDDYFDCYKDHEEDYENFGTMEEHCAYAQVHFDQVENDIIGLHDFEPTIPSDTLALAAAAIERAFRLYEKDHKIFAKGKDGGKVAPDVSKPAMAGKILSQPMQIKAVRGVSGVMTTRDLNFSRDHFISTVHWWTPVLYYNLPIPV